MRLQKINLILAIICVSWGQQAWGSKGVSQTIPTDFNLQNTLSSYQTQGQNYTKSLWTNAGNTKPGEYMNKQLFKAMTDIRDNTKQDTNKDNIKLFLEGIKDELRSIFKTSRLLGASGQEKIRALIVIIEILQLTNLDWTILSSGEIDLLQDGKINSAQCINLFESKTYTTIENLDNLTPIISPSSNYNTRAAYQFDQNGDRKDTNNNISNRRQQTLEFVEEKKVDGNKLSLYTRTLFDFTLNSNGQISSVDFNKIHKTARDAKDALNRNQPQTNSPTIATIIKDLGKAIYLFEQKKKSQNGISSGVITTFKYDSYLVQKLTKFFYKEMRDTYNKIIGNPTKLNDPLDQIKDQIKINTIIQITRGIIDVIKEQNSQLVQKTESANTAKQANERYNVETFGKVGKWYNNSQSSLRTGVQAISDLGPQVQTDFKQLLLQNCLRILYVYEALNALNSQQANQQPISVTDTDTDDEAKGENYGTIDEQAQPAPASSGKWGFFNL